MTQPVLPIVRPLDRFLTPREVAVIGASEHPDSLGRSVLLNLIAGGFEGPIHPVDRAGGRLLGLEVRTDLHALAGQVDLAVIACDRHHVADALADCLAARVPAAVVMASDELDPGLVTACRLDGLRLLGPGSFGVINPRLRLNATCAPSMPLSGRVAFLSQSGGLCSAMLDWSRRKHFGFSSILALGGMADIGWGELFDWFSSDSATDSVAVAMEQIGDLSAFLGAARELAITKPVVALKARRTPAGAGIRDTETEADAVVDAAFRRAGVLRADRLEELFGLTEALAKQPRPTGRRLAVIGNASGLGVLAADALASAGGELAELEPSTRQAVTHASDSPLVDPVYLGADAGPDRYLAAAREVCADPSVDGLLAILAPQEITDPLRCATALVRGAASWNRPLFACWMGGARSDEARDFLSEHGVAVFTYPDAAARTFAHLAEQGRVLEELYATPPAKPDASMRTQPSLIAEVLAVAKAENRTQLTPEEAVRLLTAYGIPVAVPAITVDPQRFLPVKPGAPDKPWELAVGIRTSAQVGPVVLFGAGGERAMVIDDRAIDLAPVDAHLARRLIMRTRVGRALAEDGRPDLDDLDNVIERLALLACDHPRLALVEVNPLILTAGGPIAASVQARVHPWDVTDEELPRPALRPYPAEYASSWTLHDGTPVRIRPISPADEPSLAEFHRGLSDETVSMRYFRHLPIDQRTEHRRLARICFSNHARDLVMVVEHPLPGGRQVIIGVGRLSRNRWANEAELAIVVTDAWQHNGLGRQLIRVLADIARREGIPRVIAWTLPANLTMQHMLEQSGFTVICQPGEPLAFAEMVLGNSIP